MEKIKEEKGRGRGGGKGLENDRQEGSRDLRRLYYKYKQGKRNEGRRGEVNDEKRRKLEESRRRHEEEGFQAQDGKRRSERRRLVKQKKETGVVRREKPVFVTEERRFKAPKLAAVMEERSSDSRLTDSRIDSRIASEIHSKPKLTFTDSKPDSISSKPARSQQPRRDVTKKKKSAGKVTCCL